VLTGVKHTLCRCSSTVAVGNNLGHVPACLFSLLNFCACFRPVGQGGTAGYHASKYEHACSTCSFLTASSTLPHPPQSLCKDWYCITCLPWHATHSWVTQQARWTTYIACMEGLARCQQVTQDHGGCGNWLESGIWGHQPPGSNTFTMKRLPCTTLQSVHMMSAFPKHRSMLSLSKMKSGAATGRVLGTLQQLLLERASPGRVLGSFAAIRSLEVPKVRTSLPGTIFMLTRLCEMLLSFSTVILGGGSQGWLFKIGPKK
jgi:hypothetical protein